MPADWVTERRVVVSRDPKTLAQVVARRVLTRLAAWTAEPDRTVHLALTGGTMGIAVLAAVARSSKRESVNWNQVHFWWGDERFVPRADADRNAGQAREALLDSLAVAPENIHEMAASDDGIEMDAGAQAYADELAKFAQSAEKPWPTFDICFLGVGPDAHIASLFPDRAEITVTDRSVVPVRDAPKPPPLRLSLTRPVINSSDRVWLVLAGTDKASALGLALAGASYASVPAAGAKGRKKTMLFVDEAAAAEVPPELIDPEDD